MARDNLYSTDILSGKEEVMRAGARSEACGRVTAEQLKPVRYRSLDSALLGRTTCSNL